MGKGPTLPSGLTRRYVEESLRRAAELGHDLYAELEHAKVSKNGYGYASRCSCGWVSTPKTKRIKAFVAGFIHIGEILGDDRFATYAAPEPAEADVSEPLLANGGV